MLGKEDITVSKCLIKSTIHFEWWLLFAMFRQQDRANRSVKNKESICWYDGCIMISELISESCDLLELLTDQYLAGWRGVMSIVYIKY